MENNQSVVENARMDINELTLEYSYGQIGKCSEYHRRGFYPLPPSLLPPFLSWELGINLSFLNRGDMMEVVCEKVDVLEFFTMVQRRERRKPGATIQRQTDKDLNWGGGGGYEKASREGQRKEWEPTALSDYYGSERVEKEQRGRDMSIMTRMSSPCNYNKASSQWQKCTGRSERREVLTSVGKVLYLRWRGIDLENVRQELQTDDEVIERSGLEVQICDTSTWRWWFEWQSQKMR